MTTRKVEAARRSRRCMAVRSVRRANAARIIWSAAWLRGDRKLCRHAPFAGAMVWLLLPLAGGQSLVASLNMRLSSPSLLVDINDVSGLDGITVEDGAVEIGALVRHAQAEHSDTIARHAPLIARALPHVAHPAIRNRGTIGGSIAFADPAAELPACLVALGGEVDVAGPDGKRTIKADDFFTALFETALGPQDVLTAIRVPAARKDTSVGFAELARRQGDYAMVGLAAAARAA